MVAIVVPRGPQHDEDEAGGDGDLRDVPQVLAPGQPHKGDDGLGEEVHLSHQHVGGLRARWELLHEVLDGNVGHYIESTWASQDGHYVESGWALFRVRVGIIVGMGII